MSDEPVIRLVNRTSADERADDLEFAVLDLTLDYALGLLKKMGVAGIFGTEEGFHRVTYFDYSLEYYRDVLTALEGPDFTDEQYGEAEENLDHGFWVEFPLNADFGKSSRTECETLAVDATSLLWKAYPKHGSTQVETQTFMKDDLAAYAHRLMGMHAARVAQESNGNRREHRSIQIDSP